AKLDPKDPEHPPARLNKEIAMNKGYTTARRLVETIAAAAIAGFAALTLLWGTVKVFQTPSGRVDQAIAAARACTHHAHQPEREACLRLRLAPTRAEWGKKRPPRDLQTPI